jgi:ribose/xylose/arabinose/galactoside ABC-type transport system permease subunit
MLLVSWARDTGIGAGSGYTEIALLATLMGGTAYCAGTGFVLSGAIALVAIVLFRTANQMLAVSAAEERVIFGMLIVLMLPIVQYYHAGIDRLYRRQREKAQEASSRDGSQP